MNSFLSRKFLVFVLLTVVFWSAFIVALCVDSSVINATVFIVLIIVDASLGAIYIGGNVWQKLIEAAAAAIPAAKKKE